MTVSESPSQGAPGIRSIVPAQRVTGLVELLDRLDRAVAASLSPVTAAEGVSRDGWRVLLMLARGGGRSMGEIASHTALPAPTATRVVDRLVAAGLAYRRTDSLDRRRVLVHLAGAGRAVVERVCGSVERRGGRCPRRAAHPGARPAGRAAGDVGPDRQPGALGAPRPAPRFVRDARRDRAQR